MDKDEKMTFGARVVRGIMYLVGCMPLKVHYFNASVISWLLRKVLRYRRDVVMMNLSRSFPDKPYKWIQETAKAYYDHMAQMIVEAIWFGASDYDRLRKAHLVEATNPEALSEAYECSPSVMIFDSHAGNWELLGGIEVYCDGKGNLTKENMHVIYKALKNRTWDQAFHANRQHPVPGFQGQVEAAGLLRYMVGHRNDKFFYLINNDQYPKQSACEVGEFLHQYTTGFVGSAAIAHKLGMSVLFMSMVNDRRGHYSLTFKPITMDASKMEPEEIVRRYYSLLEEDINATPHNWLWSHKRWKKPILR